MRVLLTIPDLAAAAGGPPVLVTRLAAALRDEGDDVWLQFAERPGAASLAVPEGVIARPVAHERSPWRRYGRFRDAVLRLIDDKAIKIVHDHGLWLPENAGSAVAARRRGLPWIAQPCGMLQPWSLAQQRLKKRMAWHGYQRRLLATSAGLIAASAREAEDTVAWLPARVPVHTVPHGVDLPSTPITGARRRQALFLGRLHPVKQVDVLLRSWATVSAEGWQLLIAGSGEPAYEAMLHALSRSLGLSASVRFLGPVHGSAKSTLLAESQLLLQPSLQENFGLAVAEGLAYGLPALTTTAMPWSQLASAGAGWSVPPDADSITLALREALALDAQSLLRMSHRARSIVSGLGWHDNARRVRALYRTVTDSRP